MPSVQPEVTVNIIAANAVVANEPQKVLFVGQQGATATATTGILQTEIGNNGEENALFDPDSMIAGMIRAAKAINTKTRFDAIPLDDAAGTASTGTVVFTGTASAIGSFIVVIGSSVNHSFTIAIADLDTPTAIGDKLVAAVNADTTVPVTAANVTGTVTMTAVNKGTLGDSITLAASGAATDVSVAVTAMTGGATDPTLTTVFDVITNLRYQTIVWPYTVAADILIVKNFLDARFNVDNNVLDGVAILSLTGTLNTLEGVGNTHNSQSLFIHANGLASDTAYKGSELLELDYVIASEIAAIRALRLTQDASIARYVVASGGSLDSFGGPALASLPYFNTPFFNLPVRDDDKLSPVGDVETLNAAGISVLTNNSANTNIIASNFVTTYKTNLGGNPDVSYKYLNYVDTISNVREYFFNSLKAAYPQTRLTEGDLVAGRNMANKQSIEAFLDSRYDILAGGDYVLLQAGENARKFFKQNRTVTIDMANGKVTITMIAPVVTQLRVILATIQLAFDFNS